MAIYDLILKRRTIRKFKPKKVPRVILKKLINAARISPSAANLQFLEYLVVDNLKLTGKRTSITIKASNSATIIGIKQKPLSSALAGLPFIPAMNFFRR